MQVSDEEAVVQRERPPSRRSRRRAFLVTCALTLAAGLAAVLLAPRSPENRAAHFSHSFPVEFVGTVWFIVKAPDDTPRQVTVTWTRLQTSFEHRTAERRTYFFVKAVAEARRAPVLIEVKPPAEVTFGFGTTPQAGFDIATKPWRVLPYDPDTVPPRPATADSKTATAAVDETVSYGGIDLPSGIGVRALPRLEIKPLTVVHHGEVYDVLCWTRGEVITNSNLADPADDEAAYTSEIWFMIDTPAGRGLIPDAWFSRRGLTDKLNLPGCETK